MSTEKVTYVISLQDYFTKGIQGATNATDKLNSSVSSVQSRLSGMGNMIAGAFSVYAMAAFGNSVVKVGEDFEAMEIGLSTLLKSSEAAREVFKNIREDAKTTPFDVQSLLMANRALISSGIEAGRAREDVLALANAVSATGGGNDELQRMVVNLQQIASTGKATGQDVKQFAYAGINIYKLLADATNGNAESVRDMDVSYELLTKALKDAAKAGGMFENGLGKMQNSIKTMRSNLGDAFDEMKNAMFVAFRPAIHGTITAMMAFGQSVSAFIERARPFIPIILEFGRSLKETLAPAASLIYTAFNAVVGVTLTLMQIYNKMPSSVKTIIGLVLSFAMAMYMINKAIMVARIAQQAYNAALAVTAALSMNWVALAAAGAAVGTFALYAANQQSEYNKELAKTQKLSDGMQGAAIPMPPGKTQAAAAAGATGVKAGASAPKSSASKPTTINITIGKLIETQVVKVAQASADFKQKVSSAVTEALLTTLNDSQRIAAQ
jgi:tape measure domain-containing protein